jgi:hypothetical protein
LDWSPKKDSERDRSNPTSSSASSSSASGTKKRKRLPEESSPMNLLADSVPEFLAQAHEDVAAEAPQDEREDWMRIIDHFESVNKRAKLEDIQIVQDDKTGDQISPPALPPSTE